MYIGLGIGCLYIGWVERIVYVVLFVGMRFLGSFLFSASVLYGCFFHIYIRVCSQYQDCRSKNFLTCEKHLRSGISECAVYLSIQFLLSQGVGPYTIVEVHCPLTKLEMLDAIRYTSCRFGRAFVVGVTGKHDTPNDGLRMRTLIVCATCKTINRYVLTCNTYVLIGIIKHVIYIQVI